MVKIQSWVNWRLVIFGFGIALCSAGLTLKDIAMIMTGTTSMIIANWSGKIV